MGIITTATWMELIGATLFGFAVLHTFSTRYFEHLAHTNPAHSGLWHLLGEVEVVFGFWAMLLLISMGIVHEWVAIEHYLKESRFIEPMFVMAIMVIAASRPIFQFISDLVEGLSRALPLPLGMARYVLALSVLQN